MGIGYLIAGSVLISEAIGGCANKCRKIARRASTASIAIANSISRPNTSKTSKADDTGSASGFGVIFPTLIDNSCENILRRRQSEHIPGAAMSKRGHQRHNSLIEPDHARARINHSTSMSMLSVDSINERHSIDSACRSVFAENGIQEHIAEINRIPTPYYNIDETFGEKIAN